MAGRVRAFNWSDTPLGSMDQWPQSLRATVDMMLAQPLAMVVKWGPDLVQIYNDAYAAMAGEKHPGALGRPTHECWPEVQAINEPLFERVMGGESVLVEDSLVPTARHGAMKDSWFTYAMGPLRDDDGNVAGLLVTATETTAKVLAEREREQKQAVEALRASEERLRAILDHAPAMVYVVDKENRLRFINGRWQSQFGKANEPIAGRSIYEFFPRPVADQFAANNRRVLESQAAVEAEEVVPHEDGPHTYITAKIPLLETEGEAYAVCGFSIDITDRKRAEEQLRRNHDTFYRLIQNDPFGVYLVDADFRLRQVSLGAQKVFAMVPRPLLGRDFAEVLRSIWVEPFASEAIGRFRHTLDTGEPYVATRSVERRQDICEVEAYDWRIERITLPDGRFGVVCYFYDLSERQRWEAALAASEARQSAALAIAKLGTFEWNVRTDAVTLDDRSREIFGFATDQGTRAEEVFDRIDPVDRPRVLAEAQASQENLSRLETEYRINLPDGTVRSVVSINDAIAGPDGRAEQMFGVIGDITDRRRVEEQLRRQAAIFENQTDGIIITDLDGRILDWNPACERMLGYAKHEVLGRSTALFHRPQDASTLTHDALAAVERDGMWRGEVVYVRKNGTQGICESVVKPLADEAGKVIGSVGVNRDITDRKRAEAAVRESEERLRQMADAMPQMVWVTRPDGYHEYYNKRWYEFTGVPEGSTDGEGWNGMFHPDDQDRAWARWRNSLATGEPYEIEYRLRHRSGEYRWTLGRAMPVRDESGTITKWFGTCTDIHEQKLQSEELAKAKEEAEQASAAKSEFLATLSHELRTPLTPVLLTVSLLESNPRLTDELREDVATIRRNVELESRLIGDLLDLTRIERGKLHLELQDVDLHLIVRSAIDICQREASAKLHLDLRAHRHVVHGDSTRLQQVFWNLINNAIKFTSEDGTVTVTSSNAGDGSIRVEVSDTGIGIDPSVLPRLFTAFEQGESRAERQQAGLGLGLAISRRLVEMHGGTITARSAGRGHGATFRVELPALDEHVREAAVRRQPASTPTAAQPLHVLLVEDHEPTLRIMERLLRQIGHRVVGVTSVASAAAAAAAAKTGEQDGFDLIISDLGLPDGSGLDLIRQLRDYFPGRAIALTGYGMEEDIAASRDAGFAEHLTKPVDLAALKAAIARVMMSRES